MSPPVSRRAGLVSLVVLAATAVAGADPLDKPAFTATPAELLAAAAAAPAPGHDVIVLRDDATYTYDAGGRLTRRYHVVFAVLTQAGADDWESPWCEWYASHQQRPTLRARVVAPDGSVAVVAPAQVQDAPAVGTSGNAASDRHVMHAQLPPLVVGAVVDYEYVVVDRAPRSTSGVVTRVDLGRDVPTRHAVVTIVAPTGHPVTVATRGPALAAPVTRTANGLTTTVYQARDLRAFDEVAVVDAPPDYLAQPSIGITTGASWAAVADGYRALVDGEVGAGLAPPPELIAATPRATVDRIVAWMHARVRYTDIDLGDTARAPAAPADTLARGFADDQDLATLLVALLRGAGIPAEVALLAHGGRPDVDPRLPGLGDFDHAVVRAQVGGQALWIDPTEPRLAAGALATRDQGRCALVIAPGTRAPVTTPASQARDNLIREVRDYHLREYGWPTVTMTTELRGPLAAELRAYFDDTDPADVDAWLHDHVAHEFAGTFRGVTTVGRDDPTAPLALVVEVTDARSVAFERSAQTATLSRAATFGRLPEILRDDGAAATVAARRVDYVWAPPHVYEVENRLVLPPGYAVPDLPATETRPLGTMTLTTTYARRGDAYVVTYRLDTGPRRISADQLRATSPPCGRSRARAGRRSAWRSRPTGWRARASRARRWPRTSAWWRSTRPRRCTTCSSPTCT